jgi:hypothetical protein
VITHFLAIVFFLELETIKPNIMLPFTDVVACQKAADRANEEERKELAEHKAAYVCLALAPKAGV